MIGGGLAAMTLRPRKHRSRADNSGFRQAFGES
jgi:hypothetical protein